MIVGSFVDDININNDDLVSFYWGSIGIIF